MDFGVVLQCDPPAVRTVQLAKLAEAHGFSHLWTFDSHLLWQEPYVLYSQILHETRRIVVGPMVTNPATRDWTVTASLYATLNDMYGNRTICGIGRGDSAVRVTGGTPTTLATLRESIHVIRELANSRPVEYHGATMQFPWSRGSELDVWVAAYGPKALALAGQVADGFILQLADIDIARWMIGAVREAAVAAGRDPAAVRICVAAPMYVGSDRTHMRAQCRWFGGRWVITSPISWPDTAHRAMYRRPLPRTSPAVTDTTTTNTAARETPTPSSSVMTSWTVSVCWVPPMNISPNCPSSRP